MRRNDRRTGAAAVEFALIAPLFILIVFATIEIGRMFMVQHMLVNASREGGRCAVVGAPTIANVEAAIEDFLQANGINGAVISVSPDPATVGSGATVTVTVSIRCDQVSWLPTSRFFQDLTLAATTKMRREGSG